MRLLRVVVDGPRPKETQINADAIVKVEEYGDRCCTVTLSTGDRLRLSMTPDELHGAIADTPRL